MLSGGIDLPRERHREPPYDQLWKTADIRIAAFGQLLDVLLCPLDRRLRDATVVRDRLRKIGELSLDRRLPSLAGGSLSQLRARLDADRTPLTVERNNVSV
jgi:hypothetical protein